jgi:hypothetical protein
MVASLHVQGCAKKLCLTCFISLFLSLSLSLNHTVAQDIIPAPIGIPPSTNWYSTSVLHWRRVRPDTRQGWQRWPMVVFYRSNRITSSSGTSAALQLRLLAVGGGR